MSIGSDGEVRIIRTRRYAVKPMSVDEAALEVSADQGAFIVFRNASTDTVNVLFRRPDGNLGLIEAGKASSMGRARKAALIQQ